MTKKKVKVRIDPATGDELSIGEYFSWLVQGIIRRWLFLGIITVVTIIVWSTRNNTALTWWNLGASYLALVIESVVGIAMFSQTRRDAVILRELRKHSLHLDEVSDQQVGILKHMEEEEEHIEADEISAMKAGQLEILKRLARIEAGIKDK